MRNRLPNLIVMVSKFVFYGLIMLIVTISTLWASTGSAQDSKVTSVKKNFISLQLKDAGLFDIMKAIEDQTAYKFTFDKREIDRQFRMQVDFRQSSVEDILLEVSKNANLRFKQVNNNIHVKKINISVEQENSIEVIIQTRDISGTVTSYEDNESLPGVNVVEKGTTNGTVTNVDGEYNLTVSEGATLVFSSVGYTTEELSIGSRSVIDMVMTEDIQQLQELVVVGYGTQKRRDLTGSVVSVQSEDFTQGANYDAVQLLNGAAAGVNVSQVSSAPGSPLKIQIRGAGSINSDNSVLFVVDGLPGVDPQSLSPGDIESIEVLKDASASAIYGTRAANGVVLITTKKGKAGETNLTYNTYMGIQNIAKDLDVLGAQDYAEMINFRQPGTYSPEQISGFGSGTNWQDQLFRSASVQNHDITLSGGNDKGNYYLGLNYFDQLGIVRSSSSKKYNARLNIQTAPVENLVVSANINYTRQINNEILFSNGANENAGPLNSAIQFDPTLPADLNNNGRYYINPAIALDNPAALINGIDDQTLHNRFYGTLNTDYEIIDGLTATLRLGVESNNSRTDFYRSRITLSGLANGGQADVSSSEYTHWLAEALVRYNKSFNENHNFSLMGGVTFEEFLNRSLRGTANGFLSDVTNTNLLQAGNGDTGDNLFSGKIKNQLNGFIGRTTYDFKGKYLLTASFRIDGSSRFAAGNKYAFFPSGSLGWRISQEPFLSNIAFISDLKIRLGYGELGNQGINNFETRQTLRAGGNSVFGGSVAQGVVPARLPNPDLTWETTKEVNIGIDYSFWNDRLSGSIDYFNRTTTDQLFIKPLPSIVGFTSVRTNIGDVQNEGLDISLRSININKVNFSWSTNLNMSFLKNEVTKLPDFTQEIISGSIGTFITQFIIVQEGAPLNAFYGFEIDGIFQAGDDIENAPTPFTVSDGYAPGMPRFVDQNNDGVINAEDRTILGDPFPDFSFGFTNNFRFGDFNLEVLLQGVQGIESLDGNVTESLYPTNNFRNSISRFYLNRWTAENPSNDLPSGENPSLYGGAYAINSLTVVDASFLRLKNITLNYDIPLKENWSVSSLNVYVAADNLFTITNFEGYDPDASALGTGVARSSYNSYPLARTIRLGLGVNF